VGQVLVGPMVGDFHMSSSEPRSRQLEEMSGSVPIRHPRTPFDPEKPVMREGFPASVALRSSPNRQEPCYLHTCDSNHPEHLPWYRHNQHSLSPSLTFSAQKPIEMGVLKFKRHY